MISNNQIFSQIFFDDEHFCLVRKAAILTDYFRKKADACLDALWDSGKLDQANLNELRNQDLSL